MNINEENSSSSNNGAKSRFRERLKKIARNKRKKQKNSINLNQKKDLRIIFKPFLIAFSVVVGAFKKENKKQKSKILVSQKPNDDGKNENNNIFYDNSNDYLKNKNVFKKVDTNKKFDGEVNLNLNDINNDMIEGNITVIDSNDFSSASLNNEEVSLDKANVNNEVKELQKDIISLIKKRLVKTANELEMLYSEFYILKEVINDDVYLEECKEKIKETKKILSKIKSLKEKYDYLKDNVDFDNLLMLDDNSLVDKIIKLKEISSDDDIRKTIDDYKILEEYKSLYLKIDKLEEDVIKYDKYKKEKEEELKKRDIDFEELKNTFYNKNLEQERYDRYVQAQENTLKKLDENFMKIDSYEKVSYKLNGFNGLLINSFKYLGLLIASPLKGVFPGIATQMIATKNIIHNLYNSLSWEEEKKMVYETVDFSKSLSDAMNDIDGTLRLVDSTIDDVRRLKDKYLKEFSKYQYSFPEYNEFIKKLNKIENSILNNKVKMELMKEKLKTKEKENDSKLMLVKKLNSSSNK